MRRMSDILIWRAVRACSMRVLHAHLIPVLLRLRGFAKVMFQKGAATAPFIKRNTYAHDENGTKDQEYYIHWLTGRRSLVRFLAFCRHGSEGNQVRHVNLASAARSFALGNAPTFDHQHDKGTGQQASEYKKGRSYVAHGTILPMLNKSTIGQVPPKTKNLIASAGFVASKRPFWAGACRKMTRMPQYLEAASNRALIKGTQKEAMPCPSLQTETSTAATASVHAVFSSRLPSYFSSSSVSRPLVVGAGLRQTRQRLKALRPLNPHLRLHRCKTTKDSKDHHSQPHGGRLSASAFLHVQEA